MDTSEVEENLFSAGDAKLHVEICQKLSLIVCKVLEIFPIIEAARPRSKSGIRSLCSVHVALDKAKTLLQHCSNGSRLYLAITGDSILLKFEKTRYALQESLRHVEDIVPHSIGSQIMEIVSELEATMFVLDQTEKQAGEDVIQLLQMGKQFDGNSNDTMELEIFHQAAINVGIISSRAALAEKRALKKLIERTRVEEDKRKESIVAYLLHLMRKYSKLFRSEISDDTDSQGSTPCSPTIVAAPEHVDGQGGNVHTFETQLSNLSSFNFKSTGMGSRSMPVPPEELRCSISLQLMYDPVIISSGQTYERVCIEKWFNDGHHTCPKTQQQLSHLFLTPNYCVKGLIGSWCQRNGFPIPISPPNSLDLNYWRLALSDPVVSVNSMSVKTVEVEENVAKEDDNCNTYSQDDCEVDEFARYQNLLSMLYSGNSLMEKLSVVEQIRFLLKDDEEARIYMGANAFIEGLVQFLRSAVEEAQENFQEVCAMALFNLSVNNSRNKALLLSVEVIPLLEEMIKNSSYGSATALYLNLSGLDDAKPIIGSSSAVSFLVQLVRADGCKAQSQTDALHTLYNLSTHLPNIPFLLSAGIVDTLHSLIVRPPDLENSEWTEKSLSVLINLASSKLGREEIISTPELVSAVAMVLDTGDPIEQEQAVSCLLYLCNGDEICSHMVLQEGVIPALVSISVNGNMRSKEKAQKLLMLFREQRQRDPSPPPRQEQSWTESNESNGMASRKKSLVKSTTKRRMGQTLTSIWKNKHFSLYQC